MSNERLLEILHTLRIVGDPSDKDALITEAEGIVNKDKPAPKPEKKKDK